MSLLLAIGLFAILSLALLFWHVGRVEVLSIVREYREAGECPDCFSDERALRVSWWVFVLIGIASSYAFLGKGSDLRAYLRSNIGNAFRGNRH